MINNNNIVINNNNNVLETLNFDAKTLEIASSERSVLEEDEKVVML